MKVITAIALNQTGRISDVRWQNFDHTTRCWTGMPAIVEVKEAVDAVLKGEPLGMLIDVMDADQGRNVPRPHQLRVVEDDAGREFIEDTDPPAHGISLGGLPRISIAEMERVHEMRLHDQRR